MSGPAAVRGVDRVVDTDVLVIGGGGASLRAAVAASRAGARTTVVIKGKRGKSGATVAQDSAGVAWQLADPCSDDDSPAQHARNIIDVGLGMADSRLARLLAEEIVDRSAEMERWGLAFAPDPAGHKRHYAGYSCFGDRPRAHGILNSGWGHAGDVVKVLVDQLRGLDVGLFEDTFVSDLLVRDGACIGALALGPDGEVIAFRAGAVALTVGGARQIYPAEPGRSVIDTTGDGYAMGIRAGATLTNMEFTQYMLHPVKPFPVRTPGVFWSLLPEVLDRNGEEVLGRYLPAGVSREQVMTERTLHFPFSSRDQSKWLDIAAAAERRAGRATDEGGLYLDFSRVDLARFTPSRPQHMPADEQVEVSLPAERVQFRPAAHAINGGLRIDERAESTLRGLFAAAEVATGPHGADRLGGGMVSSGIVFGARAGEFGAEHARHAEHADLTPEVLEAPLARLRGYGRGDDRPDDVLEALQRATAEHLFVLRSGSGLAALLDRIAELRQDRLPAVAVAEPSALRRAIEVDNSLLTAELMARAALERTESRGSHYREDHPEQDDARWRTNVLLRMEDGELRVTTGSLG